MTLVDKKINLTPRPSFFTKIISMHENLGVKRISSLHATDQSITIRYFRSDNN